MEKWIKRTIELGAGLSFTGKGDPSVIDYRPSKTKLPRKESRYFKRCQPERVGVSSARLRELLRALEAERRVNVHNFICIKDGAVICECSAPGYSINTWHLSHSMSKSLVGIAVGMLIEDGLLSLDARLVDFFPEYQYRDAAFQDITVEHLLTMRAGVRFAEVGIVSEDEWTKAYFDSGLAFLPGERFGYNSMNTYILARVVQHITGQGITDFLRPRLLELLGIDNFFWEKGPEGLEKGGLGVFMSIESWCKIGVMMLSGGVFEGRRIISEKWVESATRVQISTPKSTGAYDYGYHVWVSRDSDSFLFSGMFGQDVWICPRNNIVVGINSGNNELFQNSPALPIVEKYLSGELDGDLSPGGYRELVNTEERFYRSRMWLRPYRPYRGVFERLGILRAQTVPLAWQKLLGKYDFAPNNHGVLPLFIRLLQNNYGGGIEWVKFTEEDGEMFVTFREVAGEYKMGIGFTDFWRGSIDFRGEKYLVAVMGEALEDENRRPLFKLELLFPEMPNSRHIKLRFADDGSLHMELGETPNHEALARMLTEFGGSGGVFAILRDFLERRMGKGFIEGKLAEGFAPVLVGASDGDSRHDRILDGEREKTLSEQKGMRVVNAIINKFIAEDGEGGLKTFFGDIVGKIKAGVPARFKKTKKN